MADATKPIPSPTDVTQPFWSSCSSGILRLRRCSHCHRYPSRIVCGCGQSDSVWADASGRGRIFSYTVVHRAPDPAFRAELPYVIAIVALEESPHLFGNVEGCASDAVLIDMPVEAVFETLADDIGTVRFKPVG